MSRIGEEGDIANARSALNQLEVGADGPTGHSPDQRPPMRKILFVEGNHETHLHFNFGSMCVSRIGGMGATGGAAADG